MARQHRTLWNRRLGWSAICFLSLIMSVGCRPADKGKIPITTSSELARAYFEEGIKLSENFRREEALRCFEKAVAEDPDFALAYLGIATCQPSRRDVYETIGIAEELSRPKEVASSQRPSSGFGLTITLPTAVSPEYLKEATKRVDRVSSGERLWILAMEAGLAGKTAVQCDCFRELAQSYPRDERARRMLADYYFGIQNFESAIQEYQAATAINPGYAIAYNMLGYALRKQNDFAGAETAFRTYIDLLPDQANPYDSYAELLLRMGRYDESITYYRKALEKDSSFHFSRLGIATNLNLLGRHGEAREFLWTPADSGLPFDMQRSLRVGRTLSFVDEGDFESALTASNATVRASEQSGSVIEIVSDLNITGLILLEMGNLEDARRHFEEGLKRIQESSVPKDVREWAQALVLLRIGCRIALREGDLDRARATVEDFVARADTVGNPMMRWMFHHYSGMVALEEGDPPRAVAELKQASAADPGTLHLLGVAHERMGDGETAMKYYDECARSNLVNDLGYALVRRHAVEALRRLREA